MTINVILEIGTKNLLYKQTGQHHIMMIWKEHCVFPSVRLLGDECIGFFIDKTMHGLSLFEKGNSQQDVMILHSDNHSSYFRNLSWINNKSSS